MTEFIGYQDSYIKEFDGTITQTHPEENAVQLDRTAFYPGGGGQPCDYGKFEFNGQVFPVVKVKKIDDAIWHWVDGILPLNGTKVHGTIDWERRYKLMRTHTAMHILCGTIWRDYQAFVTGGNMEPLQARMDFEFETMHGDLVRVIEESVNKEIAAARVVTSRILPREEAFKIPDLIRTKVNLLPEAIQQVRVVEITGLDLQADGGTHVANTNEVGKIKIVDYKSKGKINKRIVVEIGD
jgi:misacylated tRNA(Ala) deacylase